MTDKNFEILQSEVIDPGFCVLCGACSAFCNRIELDYEKGTPLLVKSCVSGCSNCIDHCPIRMDFNAKRVFAKTPVDPVLGPYTEIKAVRAVDDGMRKGSQDGGAVTAILAAILDRGKVDAAIIVERDPDWRPIPRIAESKEDLLASQGSKYSPSPNIESLGKTLRDKDFKSIAIVDVGCHIRGLRNMEYDLFYNLGFSPYSDLKIYTIGLFCSGSFSHQKLLNSLGSNPSEIKRMEVLKGTLRAQGKTDITIPVKEMKEDFLGACPMCVDYTAELADISIGSIGSPQGYSTVIVRDIMGWGMMRDALQRGLAEADAKLVNMKDLKKLVSRKKESARQDIEKHLTSKRAIPPFTIS